ncbi:MAG: acetyltransferase [Flavobacteriales bacterium]
MKSLKNDKLVVLGSGGHARAVIALAHDSGFQISGIYDDSFKKGSHETILSVPLKGLPSEIPAVQKLILAIGNNHQRKEAFERFSNQLFEPNLVHQTAFIQSSVKFGRSNLVFPKASINAETHIGSNNIINSGCIVEHECMVKDHTHISIGAILGGRVNIGNGCFIGAGAVVKDQISICDNVTVGAGSVVVRSITEPGTYVGNPLRKIR